MFSWYVHLFHFSLPILLSLKWVSCSQYIVGSWFLIHSAYFCCLITVHGALTISVIIAILELKSSILFFFLFTLSAFHFSVFLFMPTYQLLELYLVSHFGLSIVFLSIFLYSILVVSQNFRLYVHKIIC